MNSTRRWPRRRLAAWIAGACIALFLVMAMLSNVSTKLSETDIRVFREVLGPQTEAPVVRSFDEEIRLIHLVKDSVAAMVPGFAGIPEFHDREPVDLLQSRSGLCFDRSRTIEKALQYYGFKTRHVFLLYKEQRPFIRMLLTPHSPSHAVSEVMTARGWLLVDSNSPWIALTNTGRPVGANQLLRNAAAFDSLPTILKAEYWAIPGLYSRKGFFYRPFIPFPDVNWRDAFAALVVE